MAEYSSCGFWYSIRDTRRKGRGVFAESGMDARMALLIDRTLHLTRVDRGSELDSYVFRDGVRGGYVLALGPISLVNHSPLPNCGVEFEQLKSRDLVMRLVSRRKIRRGEELTIDYGVKPWWKKGGSRG